MPIDDKYYREFLKDAFPEYSLFAIENDYYGKDIRYYLRKGFDIIAVGFIKGETTINNTVKSNGVPSALIALIHMMIDVNYYRVLWYDGEIKALKKILTDMTTWDILSKNQRHILETSMTYNKVRKALTLIEQGEKEYPMKLNNKYIQEAMDILYKEYITEV